LQKDFEKEFPKTFAKNKTSGASVVQNIKRKKAIHALTLCKLVQFCTYIFALVCVGINHQKGGDFGS
jgi:hypothetical protein